MLRDVCDGAPHLRLDQLVFRTPVFPLHFRQHTVAAACVVLQVSDILGILPAVFTDTLEKTRRGPHLHDRHVLSVIQRIDALNVLLCGTAPMIAHTVEHHQLLLTILQFAFEPLRVLLKLLSPRAVLIRNTVCHYAGTVHGFPPEGAPRQSFFKRHGTHEHIIVQPALF